MQLNKSQRMHLFLTENYHTLAELAKICETSENQILTLESAQCIPGHTYEVRQLTTFTCSGIDSALTEHTDLTTTYYYHKSLKTWCLQALSQIKNISLTELALQIKNNFTKELNQSLNGIQTPGCKNFDQAWEYWIDGTWGKCLKEISVKCLAKKELARYYIAQIMDESPLSISDEQKFKLVNLIKDYITASLDFDSYGMRHLVVEEPIKKFNLHYTFDKKYLTN